MYCIRFQKQQTQKVFSSANFFRLIETDAKSLNSLSCQGSGHSRRSSETSQISITSGSMMSDQFQENAEEDLWVLWGKIINEWETWSKKKQPQLKVKVTQIIVSFFGQCSDQQSQSKNLSSLFPLMLLSKHISSYALGSSEFQILSDL